ncbi:hypothetical protein HRI_002674700 [Hibiscus trionum]|uniref:Uncharacterized protein n=1 Tax=Hibiscus trionum TaxID=183268 RepID=A0A9W7I645_HIBTR|nr:hypothetical protein HRI_002674700 [Hibiscus trionum]
MDNFGKPNFYGSCAGENTGEDILQRPLAATFNSYQGSGEIIEQIYKIDSPKLSVVEECSFPPASMAACADLQKAEKKRKADRAYRERCKTKKDQTTQALESLGKENEDLKMENRCLKERNASLNQSLQSQTGELKEMKYQLENLKLENEKQNTIVQILSHHVVNPDLCLQNKKLSDENDRLREIAKLSDGTLKLVEENGRLQYGNLLLQVQMDALLGQILDGSCKNCRHK